MFYLHTVILNFNYTTGSFKIHKNSKVITNKWITQFHQTNDAWEECGAIIAKTVDDSSASDEPLVIFAQQNILCPKIFV